MSLSEASKYLKLIMHMKDELNI